MFDYMWALKDAPRTLIPETHDADYFVPTVWSEHCVECSAPECWHNCSMYQKRADGACVRIAGGIAPLGRSASGLPEGAELHFRKWAKIESPYYDRAVTKVQYETLARRMHRLASVAVKLARMLPKRWRHFVTDAVYSFRWRYFRRVAARARQTETLELVLRAKALKQRGALIEIHSAGKIFYRHRISLTEEFREFRLPLIKVDTRDYTAVCLYPEDSQNECDICVESLELVESKATGAERHDDKKVKLVIWDLDNTLWDGVLMEERGVVLNEELAKIIKELDVKGVVNSICSKNSAEDALRKLDEVGLSEFFVFPQINWNAKSANVQKILSSMNISADTVVFVDDSAFEREEVKRALPDITAVDAGEIAEYVKTARFQVPITEDAKRRRETYRMIERRASAREQWTGAGNEFLKSCHMQLEIRPPREDEIDRCCELMQRTNQLNCSGRRLSREDIECICTSEQYNTYVLICEDKFGSYGLVGFVIVEKGRSPLITDFVLSCRVANRKIEHAALRHILRASEAEHLDVRYIKTERNEPMHRVLEDLCMHETEKPDTYRWDGNLKDAVDTIVSIKE